MRVALRTVFCAGALRPLCADFLEALPALGAGLVSSAGAGLSAGAAGVCAELSGLASVIKNMQAKAPVRTGRLSAAAGVFKNEAGSLVKNIPGHGRFVSQDKPDRQGVQELARRLILGRWRCATQSAAC